MSENIENAKKPGLSFKDQQFKNEFGCTPGEAELGWRDILKQYQDTIKKLEDLKIAIGEEPDPGVRQQFETERLELRYTYGRLDALTVTLIHLLNGKLESDEYREQLSKIMDREV